MSETVTVLRAGTTTDRYRNVVADWSNPARTEVPGCAVAPGTSSEENAGRTAVIAGLTVYLPAGADVRPADRIEIRGVVYDIDGEPGDWRNPFTDTRAGLEVALRRVTG